MTNTSFADRQTFAKGVVAWQQWRGSNFDWIHSRDAAGVPYQLIKVLAVPFDTEADPKDHWKMSDMNPGTA